MDRSLTSSHDCPLGHVRSGWRIRLGGWFAHSLALLATGCLQSSDAQYPNVQCPKADAASSIREPLPPDVIPALPPREDLATSLPTTDATAEGQLDYPPPDLIPSVPPEPPVAEPPATNDASSMGVESGPESLEVIAALPEVYLATPIAHPLLAIDPQQNSYSVRVPEAYVACGDQYVSEVRICVNEAGTVSRVEILRPSIDLVDVQLQKVLARWTYRPYLLEGRPTAFCYPLEYRVR